MICNPHVGLRECVHAQLCLTLCDLMDCSPPGSSVRGIFQARILEWVAIPFSRGSSWPRDQTRISCIGRLILYHLSLRYVWSGRSPDLAGKKYVVGQCPASFLNCPAVLILEFWFTENKSPIALPWVGGSRNLPPASVGLLLLRDIWWFTECLRWP